MRNAHPHHQWRWGSTRSWLVAATLFLAVVTAGLLHAGGAKAAGVASPSVDAAAIPTQGLVARYLFNGNAQDSSGFGRHGVKHNVTLTSNRLGNGSSAYSFNGTDGYIEIPDHSAFSLSTTRQLSISAWMRPGTLNFPNDEGSGYVHWLGKGQANQHEWTFRMYSADNTDGRANRTSFYLFNLAGGEGAGSYVQETVEQGRWYHYAAVADMGTDTIKWYKNGVLEDQDPFINSQYHIRPRNGASPVRVGTRDFASFFKGAIDNITIYNRALSAAEIKQLYQDTTP